MTIYLNGNETSEETEALAHAQAVPIPEGYSRIGVLMTVTGTFLIVTGDDLPAMGLVGEKGHVGWTRAFKPDKVVN